MKSLVKGCLAGLIATAPMTWTMHSTQRLVPRRNRWRLPPEQITQRILAKWGVRTELDHRDREAAATAAHYAFGAAAGALIAPLADRTDLPRPLCGAAVGLGVWAASYLGWLPAAGIRRSAAHEPAGRNVQMIAAHLVWGCVAGALLDRVGVDDLR
jgi:putative membrane protein